MIPAVRVLRGALVLGLCWGVAFSALAVASAAILDWTGMDPSGPAGLLPAIAILWLAWGTLVGMVFGALLHLSSRRRDPSTRAFLVLGGLAGLLCSVVVLGDTLVAGAAGSAAGLLVVGISTALGVGCAWGSLRLARPRGSRPHLSPPSDSVSGLD